MARKVNFNGVEIRVENKVFRPREETEFWVERAEEQIKNKWERPLILDLFAGSGCIGIYLLKNIPGSTIHFADISKKAVKNIKKNLKENNIKNSRYEVFCSDIFKNLKTKKKYHSIFANPPYVAEKRRREVSKNVLKEDPPEALFAGQEGIRYIKKFSQKAGDFLKKEGVIFMEYDPQQKGEIKEIFEKNGLSTAFYKDQFGSWRFLKAARID